MPNRFSALATITSRIVESWDCGEKVAQCDLTRSRLDKDRAFSYVKALVEPYDVFIWRLLGFGWFLLALPPLSKPVLGPYALTRRPATPLACGRGG